MVSVAWYKQQNWSLPNQFTNTRLAQTVEREAENLCVRGASPLSGTNITKMMKVVNMLGHPRIL